MEATELQQISEQLRRIEALLGELTEQRSIKESYSPSEVAQILNKKPYTVREWCRLKRINATKRPYGRGASDEWEISHQELERIRAHGLLPIPAKY